MRNFLMLCLLLAIATAVVGCGPKPVGYGPFKMNGSDFYLVRLGVVQCSLQLPNAVASAAELEEFGRTIHCPKFSDHLICSEVYDNMVVGYGPVTGTYTRTLTRRYWQLYNHQVKSSVMKGEANQVYDETAYMWCLVKIDTASYIISPIAPETVEYTVRHDTALVRVRPDSVPSQRRVRLDNGIRLEYTLTQNLGQWKNGAQVDTLVGYDQLHSGEYSWELPLLDMRDYHEGPWQYARAQKVRGGEYTIRTDVPRTDGSLYRVILPNREVIELPGQDMSVRIYADARPHHSWVELYGTFTRLNNDEPSYVLEGYDIHLSGDEGWKR